MDKQLLIIGAGGHGKVIADIARKSGYTDIAFLDDKKENDTCGRYQVIGTSKDADQYQTHDFVVAIGSAESRQRIQNYLSEIGLKVITLIHPSAVVADDVMLGEGTVVMAGAVINPGAQLGRGCIVNTCASVDHDCRVGDFSHISVGAHVAGTVKIGDRTWIGAGATVSNNVEIVNDCMVGAGAVVIHDLLESDTYVGIPAKKIT